MHWRAAVRGTGNTMIILWSVKGGVGCTVAACALALRRSAAPTTLVDLGGDALATLGVDAPSGPGVSEWLHSPTSTAHDLARLAVPVTDHMQVLHRGDAGLVGVSWDRLADALSQLAGVIVDVGHGPPPPALAQRAAHSLLVTRNCYVAIKRAVQCVPHPTGVVLIREHGRALGRGSVEAAVGARVVAEIAFDPAVGRAVDAGLLASRLPLVLSAPLARVA
jgi:hypothetical protein